VEKNLSQSFSEQFQQHGSWRHGFLLRLRLLVDWMRDQDLLDAGIEERLKRLEEQVRADKVMVAFVAEFSRGKSELINAIFFATYGRRIMPARAGRTTMCPTEMGFDPGVPPCLRLLPIETRLQSQSLMEWRMVPEKWTQFDLDVNDPDQLARAFEPLVQTRRVTQDEAHALGFWHQHTPEDNPMLDAQGLVEIPRWRHALINIAHPLLKQGLVILDTPGLNAIGAEPELTVSLIPQAHAAVFVLGADTGVTKSDLSIWRENLITESGDTTTRLVVLNKIDVLWDALSSSEQIQSQIDRQCESTAEILGVSRQQVFPVSAQKGLVAKVTNDAELLHASCLPALEDALAQRIMAQRQKILGNVVVKSVSELQVEAGRMLNIRRRDLTEQFLELKSLMGKNATVIKHMRIRISREQTEFDLGGAKIHAVRSVHHKLLRDVFRLLGATSLRHEMAQLKMALKQKGLKLGVKRAYGETFDRLREGLRQVQTLTEEIQSMLGATFRQLNTEYGFSLQPPSEPQMLEFFNELDRVEQGHLQYLGVGNAFRLAQPEFTDRLVRALATRLRALRQTLLSAIELWSKSASAQLDVQLRERHRNFGRRIEAIDRIQHAAGGLHERCTEIEALIAVSSQHDKKLLELTGFLLQTLDMASEFVPELAPA
jgi:Dynamin family